MPGTVEHDHWRDRIARFLRRLVGIPVPVLVMPIIDDDAVVLEAREHAAWVSDVLGTMEKAPVASDAPGRSLLSRLRDVADDQDVFDMLVDGDDDG